MGPPDTSTGEAPVWSWVVACEPQRGPTCDVDGDHLIVATTDYQSGALSAVALDGSCVAEPLASSGTDPWVRAFDDHVVVLDRSNGDAVRVYDPGDYARPRVEFALPAGRNTHDVARVGDTYWFARYDDAFLTVTDERGRRIDALDLSPWADADGVPEADRVLVDGDHVFVSLQRLDREDGFAPAGDGIVLTFDAYTRRVVDEVSTGANPRLFPARGGWLAATGRFFALDGAVVRGGDGAISVVADERELGFDVTLVVDVPGEGPLIAGLDPDEDARSSHFVCGDVHERPEGWLVDAALGPDGRVYGATRPMDWVGEGDAAPFVVEGCTLEPLGDGFLLGPQSLGLVARPVGGAR